MGITMFALGGLLAPFQYLMSRIAPIRISRVGMRRTRSTTQLHSRGAESRHFAGRPVVANRVDRTGRPLRVLRWADAPASAGRMRISGRMADVCAELDRLAALESAASSDALRQAAPPTR